MSTDLSITLPEQLLLLQHPQLQAPGQQAILLAAFAGEINLEQAAGQLLAEAISRAPAVKAQRAAAAAEQVEAERLAQEMRETAASDEPLYHPIVYSEAASTKALAAEPQQTLLASETTDPAGAEVANKLPMAVWPVGDQAPTAKAPTPDTDAGDLSFIY